MKRQILLTITLLGLGFSGVVACGGSDSSNPPNVAGTYNLTNTDCLGAFDAQIVVTQSGDDIVIQATNPVFFNDVQGTINDDGDFEVSNTDFSCDGQFIGGVANGTCTNGDFTCQVTYEEI